MNNIRLSHFSNLLTAGRTSFRRTVFICALLTVIILCVYWPVTFNAFTNYDDPYYVTENPCVQNGLSLEGLVWAFGSVHGEHTYWHPLTWVSHMLDFQMFGLKAWGHHFVNLVFHTLNTILVFLVFRRMTGAFWRCTVLAGLFALHPLQVDTVAWVAERKNLLSTLFWLLTMLAYAQYAQRSKTPGSRSRGKDIEGGNVFPVSRRFTHFPASVFFLLSLVLFALGLMCKPVLVTLPFVLLLLDYWPLNRLRLDASHTRTGTVLRLVLEKIPFLLLTAASSLITILAHRGLGMLDAGTGPPSSLRIENAAVSYFQYALNTFWPLDLAVFYPYPKAWPAWKVVISVLFLLATSALAVRQLKDRPYFLVGWFWFLGVLVPFIGFVQVGWQAMADRFVYVPLIGLFLILVWGAHQGATRRRHGKVTLSILWLAAVVVCIGLTRRQIAFWKDDESLFRRALAVTENNSLARLNLGAALNAKGKFDEAIRHLQEAIRLRPETKNAHVNLGYALAQSHRLAEAVQQYETALQLDPGDPGLRNDLGLTLARQGRTDEAVKYYTEALRLKPDFAEVRYNLGVALVKQGDYGNAVAHFQEVLRLKPDAPNVRLKLERVLAMQERLDQASAPYRQALSSNPEDARAHAELGRVLLEAGVLDEAIKHCTEAARLSPKSAEPHYQLGAALARKGKEDEAAAQFWRALELDPTLPTAHYALGVLCQKQRRTSEALNHWREAARLAPQWPAPMNNLAWSLATDWRAEFRDGTEALKLAKQAVKLAGTNNVGVLDTLAAAYAEAGQFTEAVAAAQHAKASALEQGESELAKHIGQRLMLYNSRQPYRQDPM